MFWPVSGDVMVFVLGLTGSIGMGKSTTAAMFAALGVPVHDADGAVHRLYAGAAVPLVEAAFPGVTADGVVDRVLLAREVVGKPEAMARLESIVHPLVHEVERSFLATAAASGASLAVLDVPLLFETGGEGRCDAVVVVSAPAAIQRARVMARPGMTADRFEALMARQVPDSEKRRRAHFVIDTGHGLDHARQQVADLVRALAGRAGQPHDRPQKGDR